MLAFPTEKLIERAQRQILLRRLFRRVFLEDWTTKLIALAIAIGLWLGLSGLRAPKTVRLKGVTLVTRVSNDMEITNTPLQEVGIVVTGDKKEIDSLNERDLVVSIDLTDVTKSGSREVQLTPDNVNIELPDGVKVTGIEPSKTIVNLEKVAEALIDVKPITDGSVRDGFEIYGRTVVPAKVRVRGAETYVKALDSISTEKIDVDGKKDDFTVRQIALNPVNTKITLLDNIVDVAFKVRKKGAKEEPKENPSAQLPANK